MNALAGTSLAVWKVLSSLVAICLMAGGMTQAAEERGGEAEQDQVIYALTFSEFQTGRERGLGEYRGSIVILNFWATWCSPCLEEMPLLKAIQERYQDQGIQVIAVSADDENTQARIGDIVQQLELDFPVWTGATVADMEKLGLGSALPATAILSPQGEIAGRIRGPVQESDLVRYLEWLLNAPPPVIDTVTEPGSDEEQKTIPQDQHEDHDHGEGEDHSHHHHHDHQDIGLKDASSVPS